MKELLKVQSERLKLINDFFLKENNPIIDKILEIIERFGGVDEINQKAQHADKLRNRLQRLRDQKSPYLKDIEWLQEQREQGAFITLEEFENDILAGAGAVTRRPDDYAVTLEISALQYFPWLIAQARRAIENRELMPGRFIRVRFMKEQEGDNGDLIAVGAAMNIVGATWVETLDTKGTDGANIHLGGPDTITGYFGGPGQPNNYPLKWVEEFLYYYTQYGVRQVLNINPGTVLMGYVLYQLGVDIEFKISVYMGNDNPYSILWTLMTAKIFSREDGSTPLIGFNFSNSVNNQTIREAAEIRRALGFENFIRFEHHITETQKSIVRQPYDRTEELTDVARDVKNISAKHEGGPLDVEAEREHPSDILDYFLPKSDILEKGLMPHLEQNYLDKHQALNHTARRLIESGVPVIAARHLHAKR